jgi:hypothetical protein
MEIRKRNFTLLFAACLSVVQIAARKRDLNITVAASELVAREWHVAKSGRDTGNGSAKSPFLTIGRAAQAAAPGDKVMIHAGTYREQVILPRGGTSEDTRISFMAARGESVSVKGSEVINSWKSLGNDIWQADVPDSKFGVFNPFDLMVKESKAHLGEIYVDGIPYQEALSEEALKAQPGRWFALTVNSMTRILVNFGKIDPAKKQVEMNVRPAAFIPGKQGVNYISIDHIDVSQVASGYASIDTGQPGAISTGGGTHWIIQNCRITNAKCVAISLNQPGGHDLKRNIPTNPAFGEFEDISSAGHHIVRNNLIQRCGQAGIFSLVHGTVSEIYGNQIEDITGVEGLEGNDVCGIRLAVVVDAIIRNNLIRRVHNGSGIFMGPLYQGVRISENIITGISGSPMYFYRSHGLALIDNNVIEGSMGKGVELHGAEANVFAQNLFANCIFSNEPLPAREASGTINYLSHSLVTKQTIPATILDNRWFANVFVNKGIENLPKEHGESDYNAFLGGAAKSSWGDVHSKVVASNGGFELMSTLGGIQLNFDLTALPEIAAPIIDAEFIGRFALSQSIETPAGKPITLNADFFGNSINDRKGIVGPFLKFPKQDSKSAQLFNCEIKKEAKK